MKITIIILSLFLVFVAAPSFAQVETVGHNNLKVYIHSMDHENLFRDNFENKIDAIYGCVYDPLKDVHRNIPGKPNGPNSTVFSLRYVLICPKEGHDHHKMGSVWIKFYPKDAKPFWFNLKSTIDQIAGRTIVCTLNYLENKNDPLTQFTDGKCTQIDNE